MAMKKKPAKNPLHKVVDDTISYVDVLLYEGSAFGGKSLQELLNKYRGDSGVGMYRRDLIQHLQRCAEAMIEMDTFIIARARAFPEKNIPVKRKVKPR